MGGLFSKPKAPKPVATQTIVQDSPPPLPERTAEDTTALADQQRNRFFNRQGGRAMTMLTGGMGTSGGSSAVRFLGGASTT